MFSIFSPESFFNLPLNWMSSFLVLMFLWSNFWTEKNKLIISITNLTKSLLTEFKAIFGTSSFPGDSFMSIALFLIIFFNNFLGLFPYIFTSSSHGMFTLTLALPLWLGHMVMAFFINFEASMSHFVPMNTPPVLMPFMVVIELISSVIRPFTLAIRLAANMIAGHLLLSLLSEKMVGSSAMLLIVIILPLLSLLILEIAVAAIQAYVFSLLSTLYLEEVNSKKFV